MRLETLCRCVIAVLIGSATPRASLPAGVAQVGFAARIATLITGVDKGSSALAGLADAVRKLFCGATLAIDVKAARSERASLKALRSDLIEYEVAKQALVEQLQSVSKSRSSSAWASISPRLDSLETSNRSLLMRMRDMRNGEFVAQVDGAYRNFLTGLNAKDAVLTSLQLSTPVTPEDFVAVGKLAQALDKEVKALEKLEDAMAGYMRAVYEEKAGCPK